MTIDEAHSRLHATGWSSGDVGILEAGKLVWQVFAHKGDIKLVAKSHNRIEAWVEAVRMAAEADH